MEVMKMMNTRENKVGTQAKEVEGKEGFSYEFKRKTHRKSKKIQGGK